jgi:hypothetical protein
MMMEDLTLLQDHFHEESYTYQLLKITLLKIVRRLHMYCSAEILGFRRLHSVGLRTFRTVLMVRVRKCFLSEKMNKFSILLEGIF